MKHADISANKIGIKCNPMAFQAIFVPHLPLLFELVQGVEISFLTERPRRRDPSPTIELGCHEIKAAHFVSECVGCMSFHAYAPRDVGNPNGWVTTARQNDDAPEFQLEQDFFQTPPKLRIAGVYQRITAAKRTGFALILPDLVARLDPDLHCIGPDGPILSLPLWLSVNRSAANIEGLHQAVVWVRGCLDENKWLNDAADQQACLPMVK